MYSATCTALPWAAGASCQSRTVQRLLYALKVQLTLLRFTS